MGQQENPGLGGPFPFHTLPPVEPAAPHVMAADNGAGWIQGVCAAGRICYSLIPEEWQVPIVFIPSLLHCHDSFPCLLGTGYGGIFFVWYFLLLLLTGHTLFIHHQGNMIRLSVVAIFKCGTDGWSFLSFISRTDRGGKSLHLLLNILYLSIFIWCYFTFMLHYS